MSIVSYQITPEVRSACARFAQIRQSLQLPDSGRSTRQIVRLLGNTHYDLVRRLLELIERALPHAGCIGSDVLQQNDPFQFEQALAVMFLFAHLRECFRGAVRPASGPKDGKKPDLDVDWTNCLVRIEVYSPIDLMGFQLVVKHIPPLFRYLEVDRGFQLDVAIEALDTSVGGVWYPYCVPGEPIIRAWLGGLAKQAKEWLSQADPPRDFRMVVPGNDGPGQIALHVRIREITEDPTCRVVTFTASTHSTDTRLFFECGTPQDTAKSQWGRKLKNKLWQQQAGPPTPNAMRMLVVDFAHADTGWPDFICWPRIASRLARTTELLIEDSEQPAPYDVVLPAQLNLDCCFGSPMWIEASMMAAAEDFIREAQMDRPCSGSVQDQGLDIDDLRK